MGLWEAKWSVQWGSRALLLPSHPCSAPCAYGSEDSRQCRGAGQRGGECSKGGNQEAPAPLTAHPQPSTPALCQGCIQPPGFHTHHTACKEGLECRHSHCTDEETEAWRGADSWATGPIQDLSPRSAHSKLLSLTFFRLPVHSSPLPTPSCLAPNHRCHLFPPLLTSLK